MPANEELRQEDVIADLVTAMLSVNKWTLEQSFAIREGLEREGLFDPASLRGAEYAEVFERLKRAGYAKSDFVIGLLVERLQDMATVLSAERVAMLCGLLRNGQVEEMKRVLLKIKGVGPAVLDSFLLLRGLRS